MSISDAERLRAAGHTATLAGGDVVPLVYDFDAWLTLEQRFGSLAVINEMLRFDPSGPVLDTIFTLLSVGLAHLGMTETELRPRLLMAERWRYRQAIEDAITESWVEPEGKDLEAAASASNGTSSTTSPPSVTDEATSSSGA